MKNIKSFNRSAMTFTELIIAAALVSVVMVGTVAVDYAIRSSRKNLRQSTNVSAHVSSVMYGLIHDANRTAGDVDDYGISYDEVSQIKHLCLRTHYDIETPANNLWTCYSLDTSAVAGDPILLRCADILSTDLPQENFNEISGMNGEGCNFPVAKNNIRSLITITPDEDGKLDFFDIVKNAAGDGIDYIEFRLRSRSDPSSNVQEIKNPDFHLTSRVSPLGVSRK